MRSECQAERGLSGPLYGSAENPPSSLEGNSGEDRGMSEWQTKRLGDVLQLNYGKSLPLKNRIDGAIPVYGSNGVVGSHNYPIVDKPGLIVGRKGSAGEVHFSRGPFCPIDTTFYVTEDDAPHTNLEFLFYLLRHVDLRRITGDVGVPGLNREMAYMEPVRLPAALPEQRKIAHILSTAQRAIEAQERIIQTTTELKKALMHKLFTEGLRNEPQKQTEIGPIPESWEVAELGEFFQIKHGFAFDGQFFEPTGKYILMTPGHFHEEGGFRDQGEKTKYFTGEIPKDYILAKDDLVVAMTEQKSGLLGSSAFVPEDRRYLHNQRLGLIVDLDGNRLSKRFLFNVFNLPHLRVEVAKTSTGSKVKHTSPTKLRAVKVGIPPTLEEQDEIATAISTTERKIGVATNKKTQLQDLFRTLLHELMTAKMRVDGIDLPLGTP